MAMHLIDRPHLDLDASHHRGLSASVSAALHAAVVLTVIVAMRMSSDGPLSKGEVSAFLPPRVVWVPHTDIGGGRDSGGQRSIEPPRHARAIGRDSISVPAAASQQPSTDATIEPPADVATIPAQPLGDATQVLAGAINSTGTSPGPGDGGAGTSPGKNDGGLGNEAANGFGFGAVPGGPGVTMPTLIERVSPKYTAEAMRARIQGSAWVECVVQIDGSVGDARIIRSLVRRFGLDDEALAAARRWRFRPGTLQGKPVPVIVTIELSFSVR